MFVRQMSPKSFMSPICQASLRLRKLKRCASENPGTFGISAGTPMRLILYREKHAARPLSSRRRDGLCVEPYLFFVGLAAAGQLDVGLEIDDRPHGRSLDDFPKSEVQDSLDERTVFAKKDEGRFPPTRRRPLCPDQEVVLERGLCCESSAEHLLVGRREKPPLGARRPSQRIGIGPEIDRGKDGVDQNTKALSVRTRRARDGGRFALDFDVHVDCWGIVF